MSHNTAQNNLRLDFDLSRLLSLRLLALRISRTASWKHSGQFTLFFAEVSKNGHLHLLAFSLPISVETCRWSSKSTLLPTRILFRSVLLSTGKKKKKAIVIVIYLHRHRGFTLRLFYSYYFFPNLVQMLESLLICYAVHQQKRSSFSHPLVE